MNLNQFKQWSLSQGQVAKFDDGQFVGECVSLINQYCWRVLDIPAQAWGHAKDWGSVNNKDVTKYFSHVSSLRAGDIIVWDGRHGGGFGHIAIALGGGRMLEQNGTIPRRVSETPLRGGYFRILRAKPNKGGEMIGNKNHVRHLFTQFVNRQPTPAEIDNYAKNSIGWALNKLHPARIDLPTTIKRLRAVESENKALKAQLGNADVEANRVGKALITLLNTLGYKKS